MIAHDCSQVSSLRAGRELAVSSVSNFKERQKERKEARIAKKKEHKALQPYSYLTVTILHLGPRQAQ